MMNNLRRHLCSQMLNMGFLKDKVSITTYLYQICVLAIGE